MKKTVVLLLILINGFLANHASAWYIAGGEFQYRNLGGDSFLVSLIIYRDCNGGKMPVPTIKIAAYNQAPSYQMMTPFSVVEVTPGAKIMGTRCKSPTSGYPFGFEKTTFITILKLPDPAHCEYTISFDAGDTTRTTYYTTIAHQGFYIEAKLNKCEVSSSPIINKNPHFTYCKNQYLTLSTVATDPDGDSLSYEIVPPMQRESEQVLFSAPYTYKMPLKFDSFPYADAKWDPPYCRGFHTDAVNGDISFKATKSEYTLVDIKVKKWRKIFGQPILIGEITRDFPIIINDCKINQLPTISGINGTGISELHIKPGDGVNFTVYSNDYDAKDTVTLSTSFNAQGAHIEIEKNVQHPRLTFSWQPTMAQCGPPFYYNVIINAKDDEHPAGRTSRSIRIIIDSAHKTLIDNTFDTSIVYVQKEIKPLRIFPSPVHELLHIESGKGMVAYLMSNELGQEIGEREITPVNELTIQVATLMQGVYFIAFKLQDGTIERRNFMKW